MQDKVTATIEYVILEGGGACVLVSEDRIEKALEKMKQRAADSDSDAVRSVIEKESDATRAIWQETRTKFAGQIRAATFEIRAYTYGELKSATKMARSFENGEWTVDEDAKWCRLVATVTGMSDAEVDGLAPQIFRALAGRIQELSDPDPAKLDFFASPPTS